MTSEEVLRYCLAKPGAVEDEPWDGDVVAKVGGKIFSFNGATSVGLKCGRARDEADELCARYPGTVAPMAYIGRFGWNTVALGGDVPDEEIRELVDASYDAVVAGLPRRKRPGG
ncbi:MAG TPA: MmcQ/YjbR family DNA-binding protein [Mycobacteriales bacterium]|nr:MmcQ/YjbR family DNA-binding protein [Mycobacteriales bacterium]